ncbi:helix-turn-helix domain-containing protein [Limosilactobacillus sp.]|uniref:helix-turn-helix domain-containing protein n=1 Tax=Limosilactobacillus sp. TaxID=2773925 RepID=UPI003F06FE91
MSENNSEQQSHVEIGKKLQKARQAKGYTLDDLQQITKIQKRYLIAIEDEKFDELPGDFYVRAFVKQYADTVGLDGDDLLKEYEDDLPKAKTAEYSEHIAQAVESRASQRKTLGNQVTKSRRYLPTIIITVVIILVLAAIWFTAIARSHRDSSTRIDNSSVSVSGESRKKASSSSKKTAKKTTENTIKLKQTSRDDTSVTYTADQLKADTTLQINSTDRAWMQVRANNNSLLNRTLNANEKASVKVAKDTTSLVITVGNARSTKLKIGNQTIDFTNNGRYQNTRTVTINFGSQQSSSSSSASSSTTSSTGSSQQTSTSSSAASQQSTTANRQSTTATSNANSQQQTNTQTR